MFGKVVIASSAFLALITLVIGQRSRTSPVLWTIRDTPSSWTVVRVVQGKVVFLDQSCPQGATRQVLMELLRTNPPPRLEYRSWHYERRPGFTSIGLPCSALMLIFAMYPGITFVRGPVRRRRRRRMGRCVKCGYDLTGNVTGVCSECGEQT